MREITPKSGLGTVLANVVESACFSAVEKVRNQKKNEKTSNERKSKK